MLEGAMTAQPFPEYDCPIRDVLDRLGNAWTVLILTELAKGPCRFNAMQRVIDGISKRMLSNTLKTLVRDGLVRREVQNTLPPMVEYSLTDLGASFFAEVAHLKDWAVENQNAVRKARRDYDLAQGS
ncbi:MAG: helix-turn-helix transcriptional regulator [Planktomarina sp.]|nr:helix-turn-helix transcriptional regulator [Planktomarina sp.]